MKFAEENDVNAAERSPHPSASVQDPGAQPQYIRQTWDVSRFINLNAAEEDWDASRIFEAHEGPGGVSSSFMPDEPMGMNDLSAIYGQNGPPQISKFWNEFNEFYCAFIEDIDYYYSRIKG